MTHLWSDGFDYYSTGADLALNYTTYTSAALSTATAFNKGQSASGLQVTRTWETAAHEATIFFSFRAKFNNPVTPGSVGFSGIQLAVTDGTNVQCAIVWDPSTGSILVYSGDRTGTLLGTYPLMFQLNVWNSWQGKIVVNSSTGSVEVRKDGAGTAAFTALSGVNTRGSVSVVNYSTDLSLTATSSWLVDDLFLNNDDGTAPTGWPLDARAVMKMVNGNTATTDFTANPATVVYGQSVDILTGTFPANELVGVPFTTTLGGTVTTFDIELNTSLSGHIVAGIYDATGLSTGPGTLLRSATALTNPSSGTVTFTLTSSLTLAKATKYWVVLLADASFVTKGTSSAALATQTSGITYGGGLPSVTILASGNGSGATPFLAITLSVFKWTLLNAPQVQDTFYISDNTVGHEDLYTMEALPVVPSSIIGVKPIVGWLKSDAGARSASLRMIANGSSDTDELTVALSSTRTFGHKFMALDPTGAAWTLVHLDAANIGTKVAA